MSVFVTGDCHSRFEKFNNKNFDYTGMTPENDFIVILGDFGGVFCSKPNKPECKEEKYWLDWLATKPVTFIIVLGNHESYSAIESNYPLDYFNGTRCRYLRKNIICVERGEIIELNGKKCFCFGGAYSVDKAYRIPEETWWHREQPTDAEMDYGIENFCQHKEEIEYIFTHDCPASILSMVYCYSYPSATERYLERILWYSEGKPT